MTQTTRIQNLFQKLLNQPYDEAYKYDFLSFDEVKAITDETVLHAYFKSEYDLEISVIENYNNRQKAFNDYTTTQTELKNKIYHIKNNCLEDYNTKMQKINNEEYYKKIVQFVITYSSDFENFEQELMIYSERIREEQFEYDWSDDVNYDFKKYRRNLELSVETQEELKMLETQLLTLTPVNFERDYSFEKQASKQTVRYYHSILEEFINDNAFFKFRDYRNIILSYFHHNKSEKYQWIYKEYPELNHLTTEYSIYSHIVEIPSMYFNLTKLEVFIEDEKMVEKYKDYLNNLSSFHPKLETIIYNGVCVLTHIPSSVKKFAYVGEIFRTLNELFFDNVEILIIKSPIFEIRNAKFSKLEKLDIASGSIFNLDLLNNFIDTLKISNFSITQPLVCNSFHHHSSPKTDYSLIKYVKFYYSTDGFSVEEWQNSQR